MELNSVQVQAKPLTAQHDNYYLLRNDNICFVDALSDNVITASVIKQ